MNTLQLTTQARRDPQLKSVFGGVYASNDLPQKVTTYPQAYIANTDESWKPGRHWVAFYFDKDGTADFFDSLGHDPMDYSKTFVTFLESNASTPWIGLGRRLQSDRARTCGHHCLYYLKYRCRGIPMDVIVKDYYTRRVHVNDLLVTMATCTDQGHCSNYDCIQSCVRGQDVLSTPTL